jgi:hypothetical protein
MSTHHSAECTPNAVDQDVESPVIAHAPQWSRDATQEIARGIQERADRYVLELSLRLNAPCVCVRHNDIADTSGFKKFAKSPKVPI